MHLREKSLSGSSTLTFRYVALTARCFLVPLLLAILMLAQAASSQIVPTPARSLNDPFGTDDSISDINPDMATDGAGNWVAVWESTINLDSTLTPDGDLVTAHSADNGQTWSAPALLSFYGDSDEDDVYTDEFARISTDSDGTWITVWVTQHDMGGTKGNDEDVVYSRSTDNGETWSAPAVLNSNGLVDSGSLDFEPKIASSGEGDWVAIWKSNYNLDGSGTDNDVFVSHSEDDGFTWSDAHVLNSTAFEDETSDDSGVFLAYDDIGTYMATWRSNYNLDGSIGTDFDIFYSRSVDGGVTWSDVDVLNSYASIDTPAADGNALAIPDGTGGWVAVWTSTYNLDGISIIGNDSDIFVSRSIDDGLSWSAAEALNANAAIDDTANDLQPQLVYDDLGNWVTIWQSSFQLELEGFSDTDLFVSYSTDKGLTWTYPVYLNPTALVDGTSADGVARIFPDKRGDWLVLWRSNYSLQGASSTDTDILITSFKLDSTLTASTVLAGFYEADSGKNGELDASELRAAFDGSQSALSYLDINTNEVLTTAELQRQIETEKPVHNADQDGDMVIDISELLRIVQFFNARGVDCALDPDATEDGFIPNAGKGPGVVCPPHASDYDGGANGSISLSELLRAIQFYNVRGLVSCPSQAEDNFCAGQS